VTVRDGKKEELVSRVEQEGLVFLEYLDKLGTGMDLGTEPDADKLGTAADTGKDVGTE
jgi:ATP-dependent protease HslVU (ClpYQ) ATPase subunit